MVGSAIKKKGERDKHLFVRQTWFVQGKESGGVGWPGLIVGRARVSCVTGPQRARCGGMPMRAPHLARVQADFILGLIQGWPGSRLTLYWA